MTVHHSRNPKGAATQQDCNRFYVKEHMRNILDRIFNDPDYTEDTPKCQRDLKHLEELKTRPGVQEVKHGTVNPLKKSKRAH